MAGKTAKGLPTVANTDAMIGPKQLTDLANGVDALLGETVATVGDLPFSDNWAARTIFVQADKSVRVWDGSAWRLMSTLGAQSLTSNVLYAATTNPATGTTGYTVCYYAVSGGFCNVSYAIYWRGTGLSTGSGNWGLRLPVPVALPAGGRVTIASGIYHRDGSSTSGFPVYAEADAGDVNNAPFLWSDDGARITHAISNIAKDTDRMILSGTYPVA